MREEPCPLFAKKGWNMTINGLISEVDDLKPNQYGDEQKIKWINKVEGMVVREIINTHEPDEEYADAADFKEYTELTNMDTELLVKEPYTDLYKFYLFAMIDMHNEEYDRYQNSFQMFNISYQEFANYYNRTHRSNGPRHFKN